MAFGKVTKEDLIAAGLDPDKLAEFQAKGVTKDDLAALKTEISTSLTASVTELIQNSFKDLESKLKPQSIKPNNSGDGGSGGEKTAEELEAERQTAFLSNPVGYVDGQVRGAVVAATIQIVKQSREMAWREGLRNLKGMNNPTLRAEIEEEWKKYPPEKMAQFGTNPELCLQQIHDMVLGKHHDEIMADTNKKDGKFNLVHSGAGSGTGNTGAVNAGGGSGGSSKVVLTEAEKAQAAKFGMTEDEWIKQGEDMDREEEERRMGILTGGRK